MTVRKTQAFDALRNEIAVSANAKTCVSLQVAIHHDDGVYVCFLKIKDPSLKMTSPM